MPHAPRSKLYHLWVGLLLIILGVLFLSDSFHLINFGHLISRWWPLILITVGIVQLNGRDRSGGLFLLIIGILFLLTQLHVFSWGQIWRFWPVILIVIGVGMLLKHAPPKISDRGFDYSADTDSDADRIKLGSVFSNTERQITSRQLRSGELDAVFGSLRVDLRQAKIAPEGCTLTTDAVFGTIDLFLPQDININFQVSQFLGHAENRAVSTSSGPILTIRGDAVFGNIRVTN
ncbi:MAG: LiaI-LiaF-like domain-containing protein [Fidelibacterota bacterium]